MSLPRLCLSFVILAALVEIAAGGPTLPNTSTPVLWFKADAITGVAGGGAVTAWNDSSASGNNLSAIGTAPTYVAGSPGTLGGQPYVQFGSGGHTTAMQTASPLASSGNINATVFIVVETTAGSNGTFGWGNPLDPLGGATFGLVTNYQTINNLSMEYGGSKPAEFGTTALAPNTFQIMEVEKSAGPINTTTTLSVDGTSVPIQPGSDGSTPNITQTSFFLGQWSSYSLFPLLGGIAETIVYDSALTPSQSQDVEAYLTAKYFPAPAPEPASLVLMFFAAAFLVAGGRRRWKR